MNIIASDEPFGDTETTILGIEWGIRRCNIKGCTETRLGAIVVGSPVGVPFGMCRAHYDEARNSKEDVNIELDFSEGDI